MNIVTGHRLTRLLISFALAFAALVVLTASAARAGGTCCPVYLPGIFERLLHASFAAAAVSAVVALIFKFRLNEVSTRSRLWVVGAIFALFAIVACIHYAVTVDVKYWQLVNNYNCMFNIDDVPPEYEFRQYSRQECAEILSESVPPAI